jgi:hypothetical protein
MKPYCSTIGRKPCASSVSSQRGTARYQSCMDSLIAQTARLQLQGLIAARPVRIVDATVPRAAELARCFDPAPTPAEYSQRQADSLAGGKDAAGARGPRVQVSAFPSDG